MRFFFLAIAIFFWGCAGNTAAPVDLYTISGNVILFDSLGQEIDHNDGVHIEARTTSYHTETDSLGQWSLQIPFDELFLTFSKAGFETRYHDLRVPSLGLRTTTYYLAQRPSFEVTLDAAAIAESDTLGVDAGFVIYGHYPAPPAGALGWNVRLFLSHRHDYNPGDSGAREVFFDPPYVEKNGAETNFSFYIGYNLIPQFHSNDTIYIRAYPKGYISTYIDPDTSHVDLFPYGKASNGLSVVRQ